MCKVKENEKKIKLESALLFVAKQLEIEECGIESGFYQRKPKKITATSLFLSFWLMQRLGKNTLRNWATQLGIQIEQTISKQSLNERFTPKSVELGSLVLINALNQKVDAQRVQQELQKQGKSILPFNRIMIRDSTTQQLPSHLCEEFPGSFSHGKPTAIARIQALFNYSEKRWEDFQIGPYTDNDQSAANCIAHLLQPKDLLLQDLGYFSLNWIEQLIESQYIISRWDNRTYLFYSNGIKIDLLDLLFGKRQVDLSVLVGSKKKIPMRLIARKLPKAKARKRIKSARNDRHVNTNHSKQYYELLKYEIYLTNIEPDKLNVQQIAKLYGLRWYIEILFKSWKSYANFKKMFDKERMNLHRTVFTIYALLIEFVYLVSTIYHTVNQKIHNPKKHISILKFMDVVNDVFERIIMIRTLHELNAIIPQFTVHATYGKYPERQNTILKYLYTNHLCIASCQT
jgi:hypothetical protein